MTNVQHEIDERTNLTNSNKFELLLFRLGTDSGLGQSELFGINVFKIREPGGDGKRQGMEQGPLLIIQLTKRRQLQHR